MAVYKCKMCGGDLIVQEGSTVATLNTAEQFRLFPAWTTRKKQSSLSGRSACAGTVSLTKPPVYMKRSYQSSIRRQKPIGDWCSANTVLNM